MEDGVCKLGKLTKNKYLAVPDTSEHANTNRALFVLNIFLDLLDSQQKISVITLRCVSPPGPEKC